MLVNLKLGLWIALFGENVHMLYMDKMAKDCMLLLSLAFGKPKNFPILLQYMQKNAQFQTIDYGKLCCQFGNVVCIYSSSYNSQERYSSSI